MIKYHVEMWLSPLAPELQYKSVKSRNLPALETTRTVDSETSSGSGGGGGGSNAGVMLLLFQSERGSWEGHTDTMQSLCYPYGSGITCVCDRGEIFKCFPDLKSDHVGGGGGLHGQGKAGSGVMVGANTQISDNNSMEDTLDRRSVQCHRTWQDNEKYLYLL